MIKREIAKKINDSKICLKEIYSILSKVGERDFVDELSGAKERRNRVQKIKNLKDIKMAGIMDRFTLDSYRPECQLLEVTPDNWKAEMDEFQPHFLFVESAWEGKDKLWYRKVSKVSQEYCELVQYCREQGIPVVFWNKEDPVWTDVFMEAASWADYIFTTDVDCIKRYKTELGNDNVFLLHFAAQPEIHNPIEKYDRKDKFCFAGAYYHRYPERTKVFDEFSEVFRATKGFDIYDRNYGNSRPEHAFPEHYNDIILGKLDPSEIDIAYKGYNFGINMNSVNQSQTMFARRVFEMMASNTVTVGNYAKGLRTLFGDLTICTNSAKTLSTYLDKYCTDDATFGKYRLLGLRTALMYHLYEDRLNYIVEKVFDVTLKRELPLVKVYAIANDEKDVDYVKALFEKQTYPRKELVFIDKAETSRIIKAEENTFITVFNTEDYYGVNYLLDMVLTLRYLEVDVIGKKAFYENAESGLHLNSGDRYVKCLDLSIYRAICRESILDGKDLLQLVKEETISVGEQFCVDEFNYCKNYKAEAFDAVDDLYLENTGIAYNDLETYGEEIKAEILDDALAEIKPDQLTAGRQIKSNPLLKITASKSAIQIESEMGEEQHEYIYFPYLYELTDKFSLENVGLKLQCEGGLNMTAVCMFFDEKQVKLGAMTGNANKVLDVTVPEGTKYLKFGIRPRGAGKSTVKRILLGDKNAFIVSKDVMVSSNVVILTNHYPANDDLYRNMFVHKRVLAYKEADKACDVLRINRYAKEQYREFEGIDVIEGTKDTLNAALRAKSIDTVCVHFLEQEMWEVLKDNLDGKKVYIWSHGADIQPWWRRQFLYETEEALENAKAQFEVKKAMWEEVFKASQTYNIHFVFVSNWLANSVMEDYNYQIPTDKYTIIHNYIDENRFAYCEKDADMRKKVVSIRPFASKIYANDLTVKTILELSQKEWFKEIEFLIVGDGILFDELTESLNQFENVTLKKTFLSQKEIAELYKEYGIVLVPSRADTQGVARDEAMSCGLVPVTSKVQAIPEFVDDKCAILADEDDYMGMAEGIEKLYHNPELFAEMSKNAADRVRSQCSKDNTVDAEINLIFR